MDKDKFPKCEIAKMVLFLSLLVFIPFVSTSLRPSYLYFILNILVIALGIQAGIIENFSDPHHEKNPVSVVASHINPDQIVHDGTSHSDAKQRIQDRVVQAIKPADQLLLVEASRISTKVSKPSLFFISSSDLDEVQEEEEKRDQELFTKAETFIANFYKQLKMQREES